MKIVDPSFEIITPIDGNYVLRHIERCARTAYKTEDRIASGSAERLIAKLLKSGHESTVEHISISVRIICDRGISHELVRHRIASYTQESTRYCNYANKQFGSEITVVKPVYLLRKPLAYDTWKTACEAAEKAYFEMLDYGSCSPQEARSVLPTSLKTEIVVTMNIREWRHFFKIRCGSENHPQMREIACPLLSEMTAKIPVLFDDVYEEVFKNA